MGPGSARTETRCLCSSVRRAARLLNRKYEEALQPAGVTPGQYEVMMTLRSAGASDQRRLAELLETDQTTMSRNLKVLLRERWLAETSDPADARRRVYELTPLGASVLNEAQRCWRNVQDEMERTLGGTLVKVWPVLDRILAAARQPASD